MSIRGHLPQPARPTRDIDRRDAGRTQPCRPQRTPRARRPPSLSWLLPDAREELDTTRKVSLALLVTCVGLAIATLWEIFEWVANQYAPKQTLVGYTDTISDLALGGAGSLIAGLALTGWVHLRSRSR